MTHDETPPGAPLPDPMDRDAFARALAGHGARDAWEHEMHNRHTALDPAVRDPATREAWLAAIKQTAPDFARAVQAGWDRSRSIPAGTGRLGFFSHWNRRAVAGAMLGAAALALALVVRQHHASAPTIITTDVQEQRTMTLPDGSRITLAPQSTLRIDAHYGTSIRTVALTGEAYFEIADDAHRPFVVHTGAITTRVLGTAFTVRAYARDAYPGHAGVRIAMMRGKVAAGTKQRTTTLSAGMVGYFTDSSAAISRSTDTDRFRAWTQGRLTFVSEPVAEVLATLGRWYGYEFRVTDPSVSAERVTATFKIASPQETLAELRRLLGVTMDVSGRVVTLRPDSTGRRGRADAPAPREYREYLNPNHRMGVGR